MARPLLFTPITSFSQLRYVYDVAKRKEAIKNRNKTKVYKHEIKLQINNEKNKKMKK